MLLMFVSLRLEIRTSSTAAEEKSEMRATSSTSDDKQVTHDRRRLHRLLANIFSLALALASLSLSSSSSVDWNYVRMR